MLHSLVWFGRLFFHSHINKPSSLVQFIPLRLTKGFTGTLYFHEVWDTSILFYYTKVIELSVDIYLSLMSFKILRRNTNSAQIQWTFPLQVALVTQSCRTVLCWTRPTAQSQWSGVLPIRRLCVMKLSDSIGSSSATHGLTLSGIRSSFLPTLLVRYADFMLFR